MNIQLSEKVCRRVKKESIFRSLAFRAERKRERERENGVI
jgi:hypothetical protein